MRLRWMGPRLLLALLLALAPGAAAAESLQVYTWADYFPPEAVAAFEAETGIKVQFNNYESVEMPETKLLAGGSGFDLVITAGYTVPRLIQSGALREIDRGKLTNFGNLDPAFLQKLRKLDPGTRFAVPYNWGTTGILINKAKVVELLGPDAPYDSLALLLDPKNAEKLAGCGIAAVDSGADLINEAMFYAGVSDIFRPTDAEMVASAKTLAAIRPYIRYFDNVRYRQDMADGEICAAIGWSMDAGLARTIAADAGLAHAKDITFIRPKEGSVLWADHLVIPNDAGNVAGAEAFINFLMRPEVAGEMVTVVRTSSPNSKAAENVSPELRADSTIFPPEGWLQTQIDLDTFDLKVQRDINRYYTLVKANETIE
jgi:putrescine transport system substrate-binding protein